MAEGVFVRGITNYNMIRYKFTEADKTSKILNHPNLSDEQKSELIEFFKTHTDQHNLIDWNRFNKMTYDEIHTIIETWERTHLLPKDNLENLKEGKDYEYLGEFQKFRYYFIYTFKASVAFASNNIGPEVWSPLCGWYLQNYGGEETNWEQNVLYDYPPKDVNDTSKSAIYGGAKWCTSMNHTQKFWNQYTLDNGKFFIFAIGKSQTSEDGRKDKFAIECKAVDNFTLAGFLEDRVLWTINGYYDAFDYGSSSNSTISSNLKKLSDKIAPCVEKFKKLCVTRREEVKKREKEEAERKERGIFAERTAGREVKQFMYKGNKFPMVEMGTRPEGKVFGSYYLIADDVPFSPRYNCDKYEYGCNHWDISIVRQWLNSDLPSGQWYKEQTVEGYTVNWDSTSDYTKNFIKNTDGFLRIIGLSKSQLNPVKNVTYTTEGKEIITEDYIWIPSLTELSTKANHKEGEPLDYWKKLLGNNASRDTNNLRAMKTCDTLEPWWYWTRSANSDYSYCVGCVYYDGHFNWDYACNRYRLPVLACFKS